MRNIYLFCTKKHQFSCTKIHCFSNNDKVQQYQFYDIIAEGELDLPFLQKKKHTFLM